MIPSKKRGRPAVGNQTCDCGYETAHTSSFKRHKSTCPMVKETLEVVPFLQQQIKDLQDQLAAKDQQLLSKDQVIKDMAKIPRTVNNNIHVDQSVNVFGREKIDHISAEQI